MCIDPVTATVVGTAITSGGTLMSGISANKTGQANQKALESQADLREQKGVYDEEQARNRYTRSRGTTIARMAGSGLDLTTFIDVLNDDAAEAATERKAIRFGAQVDAANIRFKGASSAAEGKGALVGSVFSAAGTAFAGYGKATAMRAKSSNNVSPTYSSGE